MGFDYSVEYGSNEQLLFESLQSAPSNTISSAPMIPFENAEIANPEYLVANANTTHWYDVNDNGINQTSDSILQHGISKISTLDNMLHIQQNMAFKVSKIESRMTNLEKMVEQILERLSEANPVNTELAIKKFDSFKKIDTVDDLKEFEKTLENIQFKNSPVSF